MRYLFILAALALWAGPDLHAAEGRPTAPDSARWAFGLSLPSANLASIWRLGPASAWGLELSCSALSWTDAKGPRAEYTEVGSFLNRTRDYDDRQRKTVAASFTAKRFGPPIRDVAPFGFVRLYGSVDSIHWSAWPEWRTGPQTLSEFDWRIYAGFGVAWTPFDRVGLWASQGVMFWYEKEDLPSRRIQHEDLPESIQVERQEYRHGLGLSRPRLLVFFRF